MKSLLSAIAAAAFTISGSNAFAQAKDVNTKTQAVTSKDGTQVKTREIKENPKYEPLPKIEQKPKKETVSGDVKTKGGGPVSTKDQKPVTTSTTK